MAAYYCITLGTGTAWTRRFVIKTDYPTTDYGALTDMLIDYLVEKKDFNILDMENEYEWDEEFETIHEKDDPSWIIYPDEFIQGGNCGDVLHHYGIFEIHDISENEITEEDEVIEW